MNLARKQRHADSPGGRRLQGRDPARRLKSRVFSLLALAALTTPALGTFSTERLRAQDLRPSARYPRLTIGEVDAAFTPSEGEAPRAVVPVFLSEAQSGVNFARVVVFYDESLLSYDEVSVSAPGWSASTLLKFRERAPGILEGVFVRDEARPKAGSEDRLFQIAFDLREAETPELLRTTTPISFTPLEGREAEGDDLESFVGLLRGDESTGTVISFATELEAGSVTIYYQDFLEVGSGEMTRRAQSFVLPLHATVLSPGDLIAVGVDYDELILREVRPVTPPVRAAAVPFESNGSSASFALEFEAGALEGPLFRAHVADLVFRYEPKTEVEANKKTSALSIVATPRSVAEGEGASALQGVPGRITFVESRFVRGNIDSSMRYSTDRSDDLLLFGPELHDVYLLLQGLYGKSDSLPCREAADVNDSGSVELSDVILLLEYLYRGGPPPATPFPQPDVDPEDSPRDIGCDRPLPHFRLVPQE